MSRIGREPVKVPKDVQVTITGERIAVKGKLGELHFDVPGGIKVNREGDTLSFTRRDDTRGQRSLHGLSRALTANMIEGVSKGYSKNLEIVGVGYRCDQKNKALMLAVGFSHRVIFVPPPEVVIKVTSQTTFTVSGADKQLVGDIAAKIRAVRPPEPYKGKGIKYVEEVIRRKAGKTAGK